MHDPQAIKQLMGRLELSSAHDDNGMSHQGKYKKGKWDPRTAAAQSVGQEALSNFWLNFGNFFILFCLIVVSINRLPNLTRPQLQ